MKRLLFPLVIVFGFTAISCDEEDDNMDTGNSTDGADDGMDDGGDDGVMTSSSMEECNSSHECINDVCECTTPGKEEQACTDDEMCVDECEVCM